MTTTLFLLIIFLHTSCFALIDVVTVSNDSRTLIDFGGFGFSEGGLQIITMKNLFIEATSKNPGRLLLTPEFVNSNLGFVVRAGDTPLETEIQSLPPEACKLNTGSSDHTFVNWCTDGSCTSLPKPPSKAVIQSFQIKKAGWYHIYFNNCFFATPGNYSFDTVRIAFQLNVTQINPGGHFLSVGDIPLPWTFGILSLIALSGSLFWFHYIWNAKKQPGNSVHNIHWFMGCTPVFNSLVMATQAIEYHTMDVYGETLGWDIPFYIFTALMTISFFVVVALLATGWSIFKAFLTKKDKRLISILIPLQVLANVASIIINATSKSDVGWSTWLLVFRFIDIACFFGLMIPIQDSLKHLKETELDNEQSTQALVKSQQFSELYMSLLGFVYFGRLSVYWLETTLSYDLLWLAPLIGELCLLGLYAYIGYVFRPKALYLLMIEEDMGDMEMPSLAVFDEETDDLFHRKSKSKPSHQGGVDASLGDSDNNLESTILSLKGQSGLMVSHDHNRSRPGLGSTNPHSLISTLDGGNEDLSSDDAFTLSMLPPSGFHDEADSTPTEEIDDLLDL